MKTPEYLESIVSDIFIEKDFQFNATLLPEGKTQFYILTQGIEEEIDGSLYLMPDDSKEHTYLQVFIRPLDSDKQYLIYDGKIHGYDNLFCYKHVEINEPLKKITFNGSSIFTGTILLSYGIDYEEEKDEYDMDENDMLQVLNREKPISWEQIKEEGYDWINIEFKNEKGDELIIDFELA